MTNVYRLGDCVSVSGQAYGCAKNDYLLEDGQIVGLLRVKPSAMNWHRTDVANQ